MMYGVLGDHEGLEFTTPLAAAGSKCVGKPLSTFSVAT